MIGTPPRYIVTTDELRRRFNDGHYWERTLTNEFVIERRRNDAASPKSSMPEGTRSQTWHYYARIGRQKVAVVHQFMRPDGLIGGWGRPDPKWLFENGAEYYVS